MPDIYKGKCRLHMGRVQCSHQPDYVIIEVTDDVSGIRFLLLEVPLKEFGEAITGRYVDDIPMEVWSADMIGWKRENKTEFVPFPAAAKYYDRKELRPLAEEALKPFEVDGWRGYTDDMLNSHRRKDINGVVGYSVGFTRFVKP